jgi:hypothetical protein
VSAVLLGMLLAIGGCYVLLAHREGSRDLFRLEGFKEALGDSAGRWIHLVLFGVLPLLLGACFVFFGFGLDSLFRSEPEFEARAPVQRDPEEQASFDRSMAIGTAGHRGVSDQPWRR